MTSPNLKVSRERCKTRIILLIGKAPDTWRTDERVDHALQELSDQAQATGRREGMEKLEHIRNLVLDDVPHIYQKRLLEALK